MDDILSDFLDRLRAYDPTVDRFARRLEFDLRGRWGGTKAYVQKGNAGRRIARIGERIAAGQSLREAVKAEPLSRAATFRVLREIKR